jgi:lipopolysaccharide biosynthesis glycosyltransferase
LVKRAPTGFVGAPHYVKLTVPDSFPNYERYCIIDDDLLISSTAPALPIIDDSVVGLVPDAEQGNTRNPLVQWTANTGFILCSQQSAKFLKAALEHGDAPDVWGCHDQGALNTVLWRSGTITQLDARWNHQVVLEHVLRRFGWDKWSRSRVRRIGFYLEMILNPFSPVRRSLKHCWGCHLIQARHIKLFNRMLK